MQTESKDLKKLVTRPTLLVRSKPPVNEQPVIKPQGPTESFQTLERSLNFLATIGIVIGFDFRFTWNRNVRFYMTIAITAFFWSQFFYNQFLYIYEHDSNRIWEIFTLYGMGMSVRNKLRSIFIK